MANMDTKALARRLTVAEVLALRMQVQAAADDFIRAAQRLAELAEPIGCDFEEITTAGYWGRNHPRHALEALSAKATDREIKIMRFFDLRAWEFLIGLTGVYKVMNSSKQRELQEQFNMHDELPALTAENVEATLRGLVDRSHEMMVDGLVDLMKKLSWDYKTNTPCILERRFIMKRVTCMYGYGEHHACGVLDDLDRALFLLRGVERPGDYGHWYQRIQAAPGRGRNLSAVHEELVVGAHCSVRTHKNGNGHITMHDDVLEYLAEINRLVAARFPTNLPPQRAEKRRKKK